jgi:hypothetical protein
LAAHKILTNSSLSTSFAVNIDQLNVHVDALNASIVDSGALQRGFVSKTDIETVLADPRRQSLILLLLVKLGRFKALHVDGDTRYQWQ